MLGYHVQPVWTVCLPIYNLINFLSRIFLSIRLNATTSAGPNSTRVPIRYDDDSQCLPILRSCHSKGSSPFHFTGHSTPNPRQEIQDISSPSVGGECAAPSSCTGAVAMLDAWQPSTADPDTCSTCPARTRWSNTRTTRDDAFCAAS